MDKLAMHAPFLIQIEMALRNYVICAQIQNKNANPNLVDDDILQIRISLSVLLTAKQIGCGSPDPRTLTSGDGYVDTESRYRPLSTIT